MRAASAPKAIAREAQRDERIVMRPDRAIVIAHRIVTRLVEARVRMPQPEKKVAVHQGADDLRRARANARCR